jgi:hypothetical protein
VTNGPLTQKTLFNIFGYSTPGIYNTSGTNISSAGAGTVNFLKWGTFANNGWTVSNVPSYAANGVSMNIPVAGYYQMSYTLGTTSAGYGEMFISLQPTLSAFQFGAGNLLAAQGWNSTFCNDASVSTTCGLNPGQVLNFGFSSPTGPTTVGDRSSLQITLLQRYL